MEKQGHPPSYNTITENPSDQPVPTDANQPDPSKGYPPNQLQPTMNTPAPATHIVMAPLVGPASSPMVCPQCRNQISTVIKRGVATKAHIAAAIICCLGGCCGCCLIPYCMNTCKVVNHTCPSCGAFLGTYGN